MQEEKIFFRNFYPNGRSEEKFLKKIFFLVALSLDNYYCQVIYSNIERFSTSLSSEKHNPINYSLTQS